MTLMLVENMSYERACKALTDSGYEISSVQTFHDGVGARYTFTIKKDGKEISVTDTSNKAALEAAYHAIESDTVVPSPAIPAEPALEPVVPAAAPDPKSVAPETPESDRAPMATPEPAEAASEEPAEEEPAEKK